MNEFVVEVTETLQRQIVVVADNEMDAEQMVRDLYANENIVLGSQDWKGTEISVRGE